MFMFMLIHFYTYLTYIWSILSTIKMNKNKNSPIAKISLCLVRNFYVFSIPHQQQKHKSFYQKTLKKHIFMYKYKSFCAICLRA